MEFASCRQGHRVWHEAFNWLQSFGILIHIRKRMEKTRRIGVMLVILKDILHCTVFNDFTCIYNGNCITSILPRHENHG